VVLIVPPKLLPEALTLQEIEIRADCFRQGPLLVFTHSAMIVGRAMLAGGPLDARFASTQSR
jgi:hypothetical protein